MEKIAICSVFDSVCQISGSVYMTHAATDNISSFSTLDSGLSSFAFSFLILPVVTDYYLVAVVLRPGC